MQKSNTKNSNKVVNKVTLVEKTKLTDEQFSALISKKNSAIDKAMAKETEKTLKLPLPKKVNLLVAERKVIKDSIMEERYKLSFNLNAIKERADNYIALLQSEYKVTIDKDELFNLRAPSFIPYLTEGQIKAQQNNGNRWSVSLVLILIAKYIKNK
jgi:hypothetical protein